VLNVKKAQRDEQIAKAKAKAQELAKAQEAHQKKEATAVAASIAAPNETEDGKPMVEGSGEVTTTVDGAAATDSEEPPSAENSQDTKMNVEGEGHEADENGSGSVVENASVNRVAGTSFEQDGSQIEAEITHGGSGDDNEIFMMVLDERAANPEPNMETIDLNVTQDLSNSITMSDIFESFSQSLPNGNLDAIVGNDGIADSNRAVQMESIMDED
jgi:hypothetical protein